MSLAGDHRSSKKDLKERISGMFKRSGSTSRSGSRAGSQEKILNDSMQRPISIAPSNENSSNTLPRNFSLSTQKPAEAPTKVRFFELKKKWNFLKNLFLFSKTKPPTPTGQRKVIRSTAVTTRSKN